MPQGAEKNSIVIHQVPSPGEVLRLVKNLRGVVYFAEASELVLASGWLRRKFQYRFLGYAPFFEKEFCSAGLSSKKPFRKLYCPPVISEVVDVIKDGERPAGVLESLLLASYYISPLLLVGESSLDHFLRFSLHTLEAPELEDRSAKLHLRILDYAILDAHRESCELSLRAVLEASERLKEGKRRGALKPLTEAIKMQRKFSRDDCEKRFWRLRELDGANPRPTILYLHPLIPFQEFFKETKAPSGLMSILEKGSPEIEPCLSVLPTFVLRTAG